MNLYRKINVLHHNDSNCQLYSYKIKRNLTMIARGDKALQHASLLEFTELCSFLEHRNGHIVDLNVVDIVGSDSFVLL